MEEVIIRGKSFTRDEVCSYGQKKLKGTSKAFRIVGLILLGFWILSFLACFSASPDELILDPETGEALIQDPIFAAIYLGTGCFLMFAIPSAIFLYLSFSKLKKDPFPIGLKYLEKKFPYPIGNDGNIVNLLQGDKVITLSPNVKLTISSKEYKFQIQNNKVFSKIYDRSDILDYEIRVDNEVVITSNSKNNKGFGKALVGGVLFGGAGAVAGAIAGNNNSTTNQVQQEVHHYTFVLKINDISNPSLVVKLPSIQVAEEVATTFMIFYQGIIPKEEHEEVIAEPTFNAQEESNNITQTDKIDKFDEIKKYKELLDMGIMTQEEFDAKKKELFN